MKKPISLLLCTFFVAVVEAQAQNNKPQSTAWSFYTVKDEEFCVALPNHPSMHTVTEKLYRPARDRRRRVLGASNNDVTYTIYVIENPKPRQSLEEFIEDQTTNPSTDLTATADLDVNGTVVLRCVFTSQGTITNLRLIKGLPGGLTEKAMEAARQIKFTPAIKDGKSVSMWMQLEYNFNLYH